MHSTEPQPMYGITNKHRLGRAIRHIRKQRGITQHDLAIKAEVSRLCLRDLETGERSVGSVNQLKIINALGYEMALTPKRFDLNDLDVWDTDT